MAKVKDERNDAPIRVLCVDDQPNIAGFMEKAINAEPDMRSTGVLHSADDLLEEISRTQPDVVLLDLSMPGKQPLEVAKEVSDRYPKVRTVVLSAHDDPESVNRATEAGAAGYISKAMDMTAILEGIRHAALGESVKVTR